MTFDEWLDAQIWAGNIRKARVTKASMASCTFPWATKVGWAKKYSHKHQKGNDAKYPKYKKMRMSFMDFLRKAYDAKLMSPSQVNPSGFHLARYNDDGDYDVDTCRFVHYMVNMGEMNRDHLPNCNHKRWLGWWVTPLGRFDSSREAGRAHGKDRTFVKYRCKSKNFPDWYFEPKEDTDGIE